MQMMQAGSLLHLAEYEYCAALVQELNNFVEAAPQFAIWLGDFFISSAMLALLKGDTAAARARLRPEINFKQSSNIERRAVLGLILAVERKTAAAHQVFREIIHNHLEQENGVLLAQVLAYSACCYALEGEPEKAVTLYALACRQPIVANSRFFSDVVGERITAAAQSLSPTSFAQAQDRGKTLDLRQTAESILNNDFKLP